VKDDFNAGSDTLLSSLSPAWTSVSGTGTIRSDGAGTAYSSSGGLGTITAFYSAAWNGQSNNRLIKCYVTSLALVGATASAGVMMRLNGARNYAAVSVKANTTTNQDDIWITQDWGSVSSSLLGSLATAGTQRFFRLIARGLTLYYDIDNGALSGNQSLGGSPFYPSGLYYSITNSLGARSAEWQTFDVRMYAH